MLFEGVIHLGYLRSSKTARDENMREHRYDCDLSADDQSSIFNAVVDKISCIESNDVILNTLISLTSD